MTPSTNAKGSDNIQFIQVMRGVAALAVVFFHTNLILGMKEYGGHRIFEDSSRNGWLGVNLFFVISGYVILSAHAKDIGLPGRICLYSWKRFIRLYPLYWILLTLFVAASAFRLGPTNFKWEVGHLVSAYSLLAVVDAPTLPLKVAWTLLFEVKFYIIFGILILAPRIGLACLLLWGALILMRNMISPPPDWGYFSQGWGLLNMWNLNFLCGMTAFLATRKLKARLGPWFLTAGVVSLTLTLAALGGGMDENAKRPEILLIFALIFASIILGGVLTEQLTVWRVPGWMKLIGDASYSVYLVHSAAISAMAAIVRKIGFDDALNRQIFLMIFILAASLGILVHLLLERPLLNRLRSITMGKCGLESTHARA